MPTQAEVRACVDYDPETGLFTNRRKGNITGCLNAYGYVHVSIGKRVFRAHRLAFIWMTGECPEGVDHIDGIRSNNAWKNLRAATQEQNLANMRNIDGYRITPGGKFAARLSVKNHQVHLGTFDNPEDAHAAYVKAAKRIRGEFSGAE
jgi:HNH endonuclease/AP2 domain